MKTFLRATLCAALVLGAPVALAQSAQDKAAAETLFNDALKALGEGRFGDACPKFAESQRLDPAIGTALYLGECYEKSGKVASAWAMFREAQDLANKRNDPKRAAIAKDRADKLSPSKLTVVLAPGADAPGLEVKRDGATVSAVTFGSGLPIDGGPHTITASAPNHTTFSTTVTIPERGGNVTITIPKWDDAKNVVPPNNPPPNNPPPNDPPRNDPPPNLPPPGGDTGGTGNGLRIAGLSLAGVGVVGVALGAVFGVMAGSKYADSNKFCFITTSDNPDPCTNQDGVDLRNDAKTFAAVSTGMFIAGGVLVAGGLALFFAAPKAKATSALRLSPTVSAGGGGLLLGGSF